MWVSMLVPDYEIMEVLWNGHKFCYFLSSIHYDSDCHETLYNEMTSEIRIYSICDFQNPR